jgi:predicted ABC-type ATPase
MGAAKRLGYVVVLMFIGLDDPDECIRRVALRVRAGGHAVPDADVRRRLPRSIANLSSALQCADEARIIDNSSVVQAYRMVAEVVGGEVTVLDDVPQWALRALAELQHT